MNNGRGESDARRPQWELLAAYVVAATPVALILPKIAGPREIVIAVLLAAVTGVRVAMPRPLTTVEGSRDDLAAPGRPKRSGARLAAQLGVCFVVSGLLLPFTLHLPPFVEFHLVLLAWWALTTALLAALLHRGVEVSDDHRYKRLGVVGDDAAIAGSLLFDLSWLGCLGELWIIFAPLVVLYAVFWAAIAMEFLLPALAFVVYSILRAMLTRVVNDAHDCNRRIGRSIAWASLWSTLHAAPLALFVWIAHLVVRGAHP